MAFQQTDLDALNAALVSGAKYVRIGDRLIEYRTQAELVAVISYVQSQLAASAPLTTSPNLIQPTFSKFNNGGGHGEGGGGPADGGGGPWY